MRFDGYYVFADYLKVDNLQPRAFALAKWRLREILFGLNINPRGNAITSTQFINLVCLVYMGL